MNIVIVEDSPPIRRLLDRNLRSVAGVNIVGEAWSEIEALALIRGQKPDLVLLDLSLGSGGTGINVLRQLRAENINCKVIVLTNQPLDGYRSQCMALGADGFYDKATDISIVLKMVRDWIVERASMPGALNDAPTSPMSLRDALTSLPTRNALLERLDLALRIARRDNHALAVFVVALEDMPAIRHGHGMQRSDELILQAGSRLTGAFERSDIVARSSDDGFAVVMTRIENEEAADRIGQQIVDLMEPAFVSGARSVPLASGVGMVLFPQNGSTAQALLSLADHRARQAALAQKPAFARTQAGLISADPESLLPRLRAAIGTPALTLAFQPQCNLENGELCGVEALARWTDPTRGPIGPNEFIPLAEENGLIHELSNHLFDTALSERRRLTDAGLVLPRLALNVSALQVRPALIDLWAELLERHDTRAQDIELEFTETAVLSDGPEVTRTLRTLRDMGFSLALDDFGVGYSSLSMLQRLPINTLKIDRSFVADIEHAPRSAAIVGSMIRLAQGLNIRVIAEGVEREQQLGILKDMGCHEIQGYLLARPLPAPAFARWIERHRSTPWAYAQQAAVSGFPAALPVFTSVPTTA